MQIIRQSSFRSTPWKNGGGVTHEAWRSPADGAAFRWRVSVATLAESGPFSDFSGYRRYMALLRGAGLHLRFADETTSSLHEVGALIAFDGGLAAHCELLAGACTDLNLMGSTALPAPRVRVLRLASPWAPDAGPRETVLVFVIAGSVIVAAAGGGREILAPWDLAVATAAEDGTVRLSSVDEFNPAQVFVANLVDTV